MPLVGSRLVRPIQLAQLLQPGLKRAPDAQALVALDNRLTWRQLDAATANLASNLSIRDNDGEEVPTGGQGVLWIKSPSMTSGYWNDPAATAAVIVDGWLDSGDIMKADGDGYLYFCGRKKQIIVHDGSNIAPQEVEEALLEHDAVESACGVGVRDLVHGENVRAYVTIREGATRPTSQTLIEFARARVGYKAPEDVVFLKVMPLNAVGKVDRTALKRMAAPDRPGL